MRRLLHRVDPNDERGVTILIMALSLVVVFGMTVLVVDLGALIVKHRGLVNANDAAAVAAAATFAVNDDEGRARGEADRLAQKNVGDAQRDALSGWNVTTGLPGLSCDPASCGSVKVEYKSGQALFFGPAIGLGENVTAHGAATAIWGPAGGGRPAPIAVHMDWLDQCGVPNNDPPTDCAFWLDGRSGDDDDDGGGDSRWAWINLNRWNVSRSAPCPSVDPADLSDWVSGRDVPQVRVNVAPTPTLVCTASGRPGQEPIFGVLEDQEGRFKVFPVNDTAGQAGDKYAIAGFTVLRIDDVIRGDRDGDPGGHFPCVWDDVDLEPDTPVDLKLQSCDLTGLHYPGEPTKPYPRIKKGNKEFTGNVTGQCAELDFCYDVDDQVITWQSEPVNKATIDWEYVVPPSPGQCGLHEFDEDAVCLVVSWQGYRTGGINPGGGVDFGLRAIRLSA